MLQQLSLLHEQLASLAFNCPVHSSKAADTEAAAQVSGSSSSLGEWLSRLEAESAAAATQLASALVAAACCGQHGMHAAASQQLSGLVRASALLLLRHAPQAQRAWLLRLLLREAVSAAPDDDGLMEARACRSLLAGAELYEVAGLDAEWPQAAASLLLGLLDPAGAHVWQDVSGQTMRHASRGLEGHSMDLAAWDGAAAVLRRHSMPDESTETPIRQAGLLQQDGDAGSQQAADTLPTVSSLLDGVLASLAGSRPSANTSDSTWLSASSLQQAAQLFSILSGIPAPYFAARPAAAAALAEISLAVEALFAPMLQPSSSSRQAVEGAGSAAEAGSSAGGVLKALSAAHSFLARLAQAGCGPLLQACPHAAERLLGVSAAALRLAYRPLPTQASDTAHAASQVQTAAVAMLHASRGIACRVARHDLLASSDAGHGSAAGQAASERLHNILDRIAELSGVGADAAAQQLSLLPAAAAAHVCAIAMAAASVGRPQRKSNAAIVAGTASML